MKKRSNVRIIVCLLGLCCIFTHRRVIKGKWLNKRTCNQPLNYGKIHVELTQL